MPFYALRNGQHFKLDDADLLYVSPSIDEVDVGFVLSRYNDGELTTPDYHGTFEAKIINEEDPDAALMVLLINGPADGEDHLVSGW